MDLSNYTIEELVELRNEINNKIESYEDGYLYICKVRSYGRHWNKIITNVHTLQDLMNEYSGDDGIVDVYSTNPNLGGMYNYGDLMYIESKGDYDRWKYHDDLTRMIPVWERELVEWEDRENTPFRDRPYFKPLYSREDIDNYKKVLAEYDMSFIPPRLYSYENEETDFQVS